MALLDETSRPEPDSLDSVTYVDNSAWSLCESVCLSILVPTHKDNPTALIESLAAQKTSQAVELVVYNDGSNDPTLAAEIKLVLRQLDLPIRYVENIENKGRSFARNHLLSEARSDWVLLLDSDMLPDDENFLDTYIEQANASIDPKLIVGGFSLKQAPELPEYALHRWQAEKSECIPANIRNSHPGRYVFTSNVLAHKELFEHIPFDEEFRGWGWEDLDWGMRIAKSYPILHIDNTASHMGLDSADTLMKKYGGSGQNFKRICERHPEDLAKTSLYKISHKLKPLPGKILVKQICKFVVTAKGISIPIAARGNALKLWRAVIYAEALND
jgi:glycosyltransferase involved in cell wall biosynthesis